MTTTTLFDAAGRSIANLSPLGFVSTAVYDNANRTIAQVDALGYASTMVYDQASRNIALQDANGRFTTFVYDNTSRRVAVIDALSYFHTTVYDAAGRAAASIDPLNRITTQIFDNASRLAATVDTLSNRTSNVYDSASRLVAVLNARGYLSTTVYDQASRVVGMQDALGYFTTIVYDNAGRQIAMVDALGYLHTSVYDHDSRSVAAIDPLGNTTTNIYDAAGRMRASIDPVGNSVSMVYDHDSRVIAQQDARGFLTSFIYDANSRRITILDGNSHASTSVYDQRGKLIAEQDPLGVFTTYQYDPVGNRVVRVDGRNMLSTFTFDPLNREVGRFYNDSTQATFIYDAASQRLGMQDVSGISSFTYDNLGRITEYICPSGTTYAETYDSVGNWIAEILPANRQYYATWTYDARNQAISLIRDNTNFVTYSYDPLGRAVNRLLGSAITSSSVYDPASRLSVLAHLNNAGGAYAVYTSTYDSAGNRLTQAELDGSVSTFTYDNSYQLIHEARSGGYPYNLTYSYDPLGNRLSLYSSGVGTTYAYNAANELVLTVPHSGQPTTTTYDANGNTIQDNTGGALTTYLWDPENRLLGVTVPVSPPATVTSTYSADGMRQSVVSYNPFGSIYSGYSSKNDWLGEFMRNGGGSSYYAMPGDWGSVIAGSGYYLYDMLHNTRLVITSTGSSSQSMTYSAFGPEVYNSYATSPSPIRQFQGEMGYDRDLPNLNYARNRFVDTTKGRWISRDPIGFDGGDWNRYRFVGNNPAIRVDPSGFSIQTTSAGTSSPISIGYALMNYSSPLCGTISLETTWTGIPCQQGWVIQHVIRTVHYDRGCLLGIPSGSTDDNDNFWEAYKIDCKNGQTVVYSDNCGNGWTGTTFDEFSFSEYKRVGSYDSTGYTKFYPGPTLPVSSSGWNQVYISSANPCSFTTRGPKVAKWTDSGQQKHLKVASWDCCCNPSHQFGNVHTP